MTLDRIALSRFRNHQDSALEQTAQFNVLLGENGAGKTNVLEALSLLSPGRGLRRSKTADMAANFDDGGFGIAASLVIDAEPVRLATYCEPANPGRRLVQINGAVSPAIKLGEWLAVGWLTPAMDGLFADSAGARRRYMDRLTVALDPSHARNAARFEAALRERNRLLSDETTPDPIWLEGVEAQMAEHGGAIRAAREHLVEQITETLSQLPEEPFARPTLIYQPGCVKNPDELANMWRDQRSSDRAAGRTLNGPHRDELLVTLSRGAMPAANCSTGEQKAMLIAITLAHAQLAARDRPSVLLLDEVAAHLDPVRREALFERLAQGSAQVWITGTEPALFDAILDNSASWRVSDGSLKRLT